MKETLKNIGRLEEIASVLLKHGFGHIVDRLGIGERLALRKRAGEEAKRLSRAERVRKVLEELGPTFVKFGQVMSLRSDLLPDDVIVELRKLQDTVPPFSVKEVKSVIVEELGKSVEELYGSFDEEPLAAASIGQVHRATLKDGTDVAVKVERPGIEAVIKRDVEIMHTLSRLFEKYIPESRYYDPVGLVDEFEKTITRELDFVIEGRSGQRFSEDFSGDERVHVPAVIGDLTKRRVLTAEFSAGKKVSDFFGEGGTKRHNLARRINDLYLTQIFEHGFFHADPHPGNIFVMDDGSICFHDFGIVGELDERMKENLADLFFAFVDKDIDGIVDAYLSMGAINEDIDRDAFKRDIGDFINAYYRLPMKDFSFAEVMRNLISIGKKYHIKVKRELLLLGKTLMGVESIVRSLDPDFNLVENIRPYATTLMLRGLMPAMSKKDIYKAVRTINRFSRDLPEDLTRLVKSLSEKGLELKLRHEKLEDLEAHIDKASNRLSFSLIIAAIIVGSSIIMQIHIGPSYDGIPLIGFTGYIIALMLGLWLLWSIFKSGEL